MRSFRAAVFMIAVLTPVAAGSAVFIVPTDTELIQKSSAIVVGTVTEIHSEFSVDGPIVTHIDLDIEEVLKGSIERSEPLRITEDGGIVGEYFTAVSGSPSYWTGNRALIFLERRDDGSWRTWGMSLGKFDFVRDGEGRTLAVRWARNADDVVAWSASGHPHEEKLRDASLFLAFLRSYGIEIPGPTLRSRTLSEHMTAGYFVDPAETEQEVSFLTPVTHDHFPPSAYVDPDFRWRVFDDGGSVGFRSNGSQPGYDSTGAAQRGMAAWNNDSGSNVNYQLLGATNAGFTQDSINTIVFNSSSDVPSGSVGFARWFGGATHTYKGETFYSITEGDVAIKSNFGFSQKIFDEVVTHELGHTLGFRHSDQGTPSSTQAVMKAIGSGIYGASLGPWDVEAVRHVYEQTTVVLVPPQGLQFTDDPLVPGVTVIKAIHLIELRNAVNTWRTAAGLAPVTVWTDPNPTGATIKAIHIIELRNALEPALRAFGRSPSFSPGVAPGQVVRAVHFQELRNLMK